MMVYVRFLIFCWPLLFIFNSSLVEEQYKINPRISIACILITIHSNSASTTTNTAIPKFIKANVNNHFIDLSIFIIIPRAISTTTDITATINIIPPALKFESKDTYSTVY